MARKVLYLITKPTIDFLLEAALPSQESSVILLQEAVHLQNVPGNRIYVLQDDSRGKIPSSYDSITYKDFINLIFESDQVIAL